MGPGHRQKQEPGAAGRQNLDVVLEALLHEGVEGGLPEVDDAAVPAPVELVAVLEFNHDDLRAEGPFVGGPLTKRGLAPRRLWRPLTGDIELAAVTEPAAKDRRVGEVDPVA